MASFSQSHLAGIQINSFIETRGAGGVLLGSNDCHTPPKVIESWCYNGIPISIQQRGQKPKWKFGRSTQRSLGFTEKAWAAGNVEDMLTSAGSVEWLLFVVVHGGITEKIVYMQFFSNIDDEYSIIGNFRFYQKSEIDIPHPRSKFKFFEWYWVNIAIRAYISRQG